MKKSILRLSALSLITAIVTLFWAGTPNKTNTNKTLVKGSVYDFKLKTIDGAEISLSKFKGKKLLLINVASECGYTPQYKNLQALHEQYGSKLVLIGFPANNFGKQEPGTNTEIKSFCTKNYGVTFLMMDKISVAGSDAHPFCISMTSTAMLNTVSKLHSWVAPWVLHMDCTFKLNDNEFPLVILGVTDGAQQLHVLSISIVSHRTTEVYQRVVQGLKDLVSKVLPQVTFMPAYVMTDAELAERRALLSVFPEAQPLMCYFHVKKACEDKLRGNAEKELILQDLTDLHSTLSQGEFETKFQTMFRRWFVGSSDFALYFYHQWVQGDFREWQIFRSAPGVASTNNAVESLNANIKKYFTCRKRFKLGKLCCMGLV